MEIKTLFEYNEIVEINFENKENLLLHTDENCLKTIIRNLTANAVKALSKIPQPEITWRAFTQNNRTILTIIDNGPGGADKQFQALYDEKQAVGIKTGLGLHLVRDMAKAINCQVEVNFVKGTGTEIKLIFF